MEAKEAKLDLGPTFGEAFIGLVFASIFYGITMLQTYTYFDQSRTDSWRLKTLVFVVWALDSAHLGVLVHVLWYYLVENYANPAALPFVVWSLPAMVILSTTISFMVQAFFAYRVWLLSRKIIYVIAIIAFGLIHYGFDVYFVIALMQRGDFLAIPGLTWATSVSLAAGVISDVIICVALCYYLWTNRTGFSRTDTLIHTLIMYAVSTGLLTTIFSLITLILFAVSPTFLSQTFYYSIAKFYTNSLLASLNSRERLRNIKAGGSQSIHLSKMHGSGSRSGTAGNVSQIATPGIQVSVSRNIASDRILRENERIPSDDKWIEEGPNSYPKGYSLA